MLRKIALSGLALSLVALSSCQASGGGEWTGIYSPGTTYYLLTNLHADPGRNQLYSTNYLQAALLPICSEVTIDSANGKNVKFTVVSTGQQYTYSRDKHLVESFEANLERYFGSDCPQARIDTLSDIDQQGIKAGTAMVGMSKEGVILAIGYPPDHATPSTDSNLWQYWKNRWARRVVHFDDQGIVTSIEG